ncbi:MAG: cyclopropane-fatty-acyl-phospholipid synthase family protein [Cyanobacteria bacterium P01_H01_bin.74]
MYKIMETNRLPEWMIRWQIRRFLAEKKKSLAFATDADKSQYFNRFVEELNNSPIAIETDAANNQHYQVPASFFNSVLGPTLKYSSGLWTQETNTLAEAELAMLKLYAERAGIQPGQRILDLGCGWGSFSLWVAEQFPECTVTALSNSKTQRQFIEARRDARGIKNLTVITGNIVTYDFDTSPGFDRIVSIEMMEHMKNYNRLFEKLSRWLTPEGRLFVHIFTHKASAYHYEDTDGTDWLTRHFFTGGTMPSHDLFRYFDKDLMVEKDWVVNGVHYQKTAEAWLEKMKANRTAIMPVLQETYGNSQALKWWVYWKVFFLACAELWGYQNGTEWQVSHYLMKKTAT